MTNLSIFNFNTNQVRIVIINGKPWFVAKDVLTAIRSSTTVTALKSLLVEDLGEEFVTSQHLQTKGGNQEMMLLSEPALTMFVSRSRTELGKAMNRWIHTEVLPAIRQEGFYSVSGKPMAPFWYQRLLLDGTKNKAPLGHFTIFREVIDLVRDLEANGYVLPDNAYPDISVGLCWSNHLHGLGINPDTIRQSYRHHYPDGRIVTASAYENLYLPEFRDWFNRMYLSDKLPKYLGKKDKSSLPALEKLLELPPGTINRLLTSSPISQSA
ncbi:BRO family protein [Laspinema sp. D1]|uniref:BRO family protein n=2 Tax=Laspinema TaxID=2584823 RepID=A0ABT2MK18_9CYAN|nr:BRO family protein [Laspinema sp. D3b]MCT7965053.1 BRO family protein [Laspinema sp. D2a]MCT7977660.1 BRO family protein [Laspinema sp. D3b]